MVNKVETPSLKYSVPSEMTLLMTFSWRVPISFSQYYSADHEFALPSRTFVEPMAEIVTNLVDRPFDNEGIVNSDRILRLTVFTKL